MRFLALLLVALCGADVATAAQAQPPDKSAAGEPAVRWKGTTYSGVAISTVTSGEVFVDATLWSPWAQAHGYVLDLDPELRRMFIHAQARSASSEITILTHAIAAVDKLAPLVPDKPPPVLVILELEGPKDFGLLLDDLGKRFNYLTPWAQGEKQQLGFVLELPPAAAFLATAPDVKEWNPKNELANRTAQLALFKRFGKLPNWLTQGLAWNIEMNVCGSIFCFPFRSGFVAKKEHRSWGEQLKALMASPSPDIPARKLTIDDLAGWKRGTYDNDRALLAWGAASFLAKRHAETLPLLLEDLHALRDKESKTTKPDGSWTIDPDYEVPAAKQLELLKARAGDDFLEALARSCAGN